ncbi:hypothetical protein JAAARDRAFT_76020 [Jaapia argillacea MUCL 33604]|uniref:Uncharacterized protein n=1 Tax=Jaapia argillacea MUCL 33604 TaxID=933084 RepID=A0A067Q9Z2_9AGAM|nr:hypothetical protein JAAARDRAFT_76020 [Jaapia argillacea MUCL 33604]
MPPNPSTTKAKTRNRVSLILQLGSSSKSPDSSPTSIAKKSSFPRFRNHGLTSVGTVRSAEMCMDASPDDVSFTSPEPSNTACSSSASIAGPHTPLLSVPSTAADYTAMNPGSVSSPRSPVLPVPPTTNDLDGEEKMRLLKKARKLSRVFGEVALPVDVAPFPAGLVAEQANPSTTIVDEILVADSSPRTDGLAKRKKLVRSPPSTPQRSPSTGNLSELQRLKSFIFARPTFSVATRSKSPKPPISPTPVRETPGTMPPPLPLPPTSAELPPVSTPDRQSVDTDEESHASVINLPVEGTSDRTNRERHAKLSERLGEVIPADLILRPSTPVTESAKLSNSTSRRRQSVDVSSLVGKVSSPFTRDSGEFSRDSKRDAAAPDVPILRRSRSLWTTRLKGNSDDGEKQLPGKEDRQAVLQDLRRGSSNLRSLPELSGKERAMVVKRVRKMTQVFGSEPPAALIHIRNISKATPDEITGMLPPIHETKRTSATSTLLSISPTDFTPATPGNSRERRRPHSIASSIVSLIPPPSPNLPGNAAGDITTTPSPPPSPLAFRSNANTELSAPPSRRPNSSHSSHYAGRSSSESEVLTSSAFRARRLRAAKLSRFFGVQAHDIDVSLLHPEPLKPKPLSIRPPPPSQFISSTNPPLPSVEQSGSQQDPPRSPMPSSKIEVDVKVVNSSRPGLFRWITNHGGRDTDMSDVMVRLRQMRADT